MVEWQRPRLTLSCQPQRTHSSACRFHPRTRICKSHSSFSPSADQSTGCPLDHPPEAVLIGGIQITLQRASQKHARVVATLREPSGSLCTPQCQQVDEGRAIRGIPLQRSCLMHQVVFLASLRRSPPPAASPLLNWVRPYKCGGYKAETPRLPWAACPAAENAALPQDRNLFTHPDQGVVLLVHMSPVRFRYPHARPLWIHLLGMEMHDKNFKIWLTPCVPM